MKGRNGRNENEMVQAGKRKRRCNGRSKGGIVDRKGRMRWVCW